MALSALWAVGLVSPLVLIAALEKGCAPVQLISGPARRRYVSENVAHRPFFVWRSRRKFYGACDLCQTGGGRIHLMRG
jgi:hypothetical protein